jgi:HD-like signal output (HDOD) protein
MQVANAAVKQLSHIATLPEVTLGIIELVENPNSSAQDLNELIGRDPALSARILKVVNSAFYGLPRQIGSINRAISMLGLNAVKNIAIAASLAKLFRGGALCDRFDAKDLWTHSIAVATAARLLANETKKVAGDEAFLSGLMHDIGIVVELQSDRAKLVKVFNDMQFDSDGNPLIDFRMVERAVFGADHTHFGLALCFCP